MEGGQEGKQGEQLVGGVVFAASERTLSVVAWTWVRAAATGWMIPECS